MNFGGFSFYYDFIFCPIFLFPLGEWRWDTRDPPNGVAEMTKFTQMKKKKKNFRESRAPSNELFDRIYTIRFYCHASSAHRTSLHFRLFYMVHSQWCAYHISRSSCTFDELWFAIRERMTQSKRKLTKTQIYEWKKWEAIVRLDGLLALQQQVFFGKCLQCMEIENHSTINAAHEIRNAQSAVNGINRRSINHEHRNKRIRKF